MDRETKNIAGLIINLVIPGLGTIIWGDSKRGITQLVLFLVGSALCMVFIGIPIVFAVWIWALVDGIKILTKSKSS